MLWTRRPRITRTDEVPQDVPGRARRLIAVPGISREATHSPTPVKPIALHGEKDAFPLHLPPEGGLERGNQRHSNVVQGDALDLHGVYGTGHVQLNSVRRSHSAAESAPGSAPSADQVEQSRGSISPIDPARLAAECQAPPAQVTRRACASMNGKSSGPKPATKPPARACCSSSEDGVPILELAGQIRLLKVVAPGVRGLRAEDVDREAAPSAARYDRGEAFETATSCS